jgi:hypothetical protein
LAGVPARRDSRCGSEKDKAHWDRDKNQRDGLIDILEHATVLDQFVDSLARAGLVARDSGGHDAGDYRYQHQVVRPYSHMRLL